MEATAAGDPARARHLDAAIQLGRRWVATPQFTWREGHYVDLGYDLLWFVQIARQHPDAIEADETLRRFVEVTFPAQRSGEQACRAGWPRQWNPYDSYLEEDRREAWFNGWDHELHR
jgi:hypothetical protein